MPSPTLSRPRNLHETNLRLSFLLDSVLATQPAIASPEQMGALLSELLHAGAELRAEPLPTHENDPELDAEVEQYRCHVEKLRELLPSIHGQLLEERARLEAQRKRVRSAAEWARASRQTL
jgi:hypothetical protein